VLLPVFAGVPGSERLFSISCLVVVFSVVLHGGSLMLIGRKTLPGTPVPLTDAPSDGETTPNSAVPIAPAIAEPPHHNGSHADPILLPTVGGSVPAAPVTLSQALTIGADRITIAEMRRLQETGEQVVILDVRSERTFNDSDSLATGAVRVDPNRSVPEVRKLGIPKQAWIVAFCACPNDQTSVHVADELRQAGWPHARALQDGWEAWQKAGQPIEAKAGYESM
jgi:rhodanese-related sulfurtransferase